MGVLDYVLMLFTHPTELRSIINYAVWSDGTRDIKDPADFENTGYDRESMRECWRFLDLTSRSFSRVIKELDGELARVVCLQYLVLRALDTVEDDMTIPNSVKLPLLEEFYTKLDERGWTFNGSGPNEKDREVLVKFDIIIEEYQRLDTKYQEVIKDITKKMGRGMAAFAALATPEEPVAEVKSISDYDLYCHYVAGLVGEGLSGLFAASGKEREFIRDQLTLSNHMGLLLQKTNILRDYREDVDEGRGFWPRAIWSKYGFDKMGDLRDESRQQEALWALSEMTLDALRHATPALDYLSLLRNQSVFNFVAIPAVMAIATLERCFMNPDVLKKNVKIRKGEVVRLLRIAVNPRDVAYCFVKYARLIHAKASVRDPNFIKISIACGKIEQWAEHQYPSFVNVAASSGQVTSSIDVTMGDARAEIYEKIAAEERDKAAVRKQKEIFDSMVERGIIKPTKDADGNEITPNFYRDRAGALRRHEDNQQGLPVMFLLSAVGGVLLLFGVIGGLSAWLILKYANN